MERIGIAAMTAAMAMATERAAGHAQMDADAVRPRAFAPAEEREEWNRREDIARGMWKRRNGRANEAARQFIREARINGAR